MEKRCRACLGQNVQKFHRLYNKKLSVLFTSCTSVEISKDDGFPSEICDNCYNSLMSFNSFKTRCIHSDKILKNEKEVFGKIDKSYDKPSTKISTRSKKPKKITRSTLKKYECDTCHDLFIKKCDIIKHVKKHMMDLKKKGRYKCTKCYRYFYTKDRFDGHMNMHNGKNQAKCKECGKEFKKWVGLTKHMLLHQGAKTFCCSKCPKMFYFDSALREHERMHSTDPSIRPVCEICGKSLSSPGNLRVHMRIHTDIKAYPCTKCDKSFRLSSGLKDHLSRHGESRNYTCPTCGKGFRAITDLRRHVVLHTDLTPFSCHHCGRLFKRKRLLDKHMKVHIRGRILGCEICDKLFKTIVALTNHKRLIHFQNTHICVSCEKIFERKSLLMRHKQICRGKTVIKKVKTYYLEQWLLENKEK